jgi:AraC-like DNA-binding protein
MPTISAVPRSERAPAQDLRRYVRRYYGFTEKAPSPVRRREGPGVDVILLFSFGPGWRIGSATDPSRPVARVGSFVAGLHEQCVTTEHDGESYGLQISLTPPGGYALLGVPMHELAGRTVDARAVLGVSETLQDQLADLEDWPSRFALLDRALRQRLGRVRLPSTEMVWAWGRLARGQGRVPVGALTEELGWSRRRMVARFREEVGLPPKAAARLIRFERAKSLLERQDRPALAEVALDSGFYDQSHLTSEFRRITGVTPATYVGEREQIS